MPPKRKTVKKAAKKAAPKRSRKGKSRAGLIALAAVVVVVVGLVVTVLALRPARLKTIPADLLAAMGSQGAGPGQVDSPRGVAVAPDGSIFVADLQNSRIDHFAADGRPLGSFGKKGAKPGEFNEPSGVAVNSQGQVLVADAWNGRIQIFDPKGSLVKQLAGADFAFYSPRNVAVDKDDNIYVADTGNSKVQIFNRQGQRLKAIGEKGAGKGRFNEVFGLAINSKGEIFVADPGNHKLHKFSPLPEPKPVAEVKVPGWQNGAPFWPQLAVDALGRIYAVDNISRQVWVYDSSLKYLGTLGAIPGHELFANPLGIAVAADGSLVVSDMGKGQILKVGNLQFPADR